MSLYQTGTCNMTNASAAVVGVGTAFVANVTAGDGFLISGETVYYTVLSITDDTHLTLSVVYAGVTGNGKTYQVSRDWTVNLGLAEIQPGDPNWPYLLTQKVIRKIDGGIATAATVTNTPAGNIAATNVQAAINELDAEKAPLASPAFTTQIATPKIVTASGNLELTPAGNAHVILQGSGTGNVGIGTANPGAKLDVKVGTLGTGQRSVIMFEDAATKWAYEIRPYEYNFVKTDLAGLSFNFKKKASSDDATTAGTTLMTITNDGDVGIGLIPTARNNTHLQIVDGIGFPATQSASTDPNTLDDYEEGTWTPTLSGTGLSTYTSSGKYTKIGNACHLNFTFVITSASGGAGVLTIAGLPFACGSIGSGGASREVGATATGITVHLLSAGTTISTTLSSGASTITTGAEANFTITYIV